MAFASYPPVPEVGASTRAVLAHLRARTGFGLLMVCRRVGGELVVLDLLGRPGGGVRPGVAPPAGVQPVAPILLPDGELFGVLCGLEPELPPDRLAARQPELSFLAGLLGAVVGRELRSQDEERRAERAAAAASADPETGLARPRAFARAVAAEHARARRLGGATAVLSLRLGGAGGQCAATRVLAAALGPEELAARGPGGLVEVLVPGCADARAPLARIRAALEDLGVSVACAWTVRRAGAAAVGGDGAWPTTT